MSLTNQCDKFMLPEDVTYLNTAYMSPNLKTVEAAGIEGVKRKNLPYMIRAPDFFEPKVRVKKLFAQLIEAPDYNSIALIPSVSYGIANVANNLNLNKGEEILIVEEQFPSNVYSWKRIVDKFDGILRIIEGPKEVKEKGKRWNTMILNGINESTAVVALPIIHWSDGTLFDMEAIAERARMNNALLVIDGTQSIGIIPFSIKRVKPDALVVASYKWLLGPYSYGFGYYGDRLCSGIPIEESWINRNKSEDFSNVARYIDEYQLGAEKFSVGEASNFALLPMVEEGLRQVLEWGVQRIHEYCDRLSKPFCKRMQELGFFVEEDRYRASHLFGIKCPAGFNQELLFSLLREKKIFVSRRGEYVRVSVYLFNSPEDLERLASCFEHVIQCSK